MRTRPLVILVDDDVDTREMYAWSLETRGFEILGAGTAAAGFALATERRPDAIVTDFTLPGEDGFVLAAQVRAADHLADTPLVLVSGRAFVGDSGDRAMQLFDRVLLKPVLPDQLIDELVPAVLDRSAARLQRQLNAVRARVDAAPRISDVSRVLSAVTEVAQGDAPAALLADSTAQYIAVNDAACALTGRSREELLALHVWDIGPATGVAEARRRWAQFVEAGALSGGYVVRTAKGDVQAQFAASAHVLPGCHLSLVQSLPPALAGGDARL